MKRTFSFQVRVEDINENPPVFDAPEISLQVDDGAPAGTILGYVRAHDADSGDGARIQYYVVDGNLFGTFTINRTTGEVKAAKPVDYEVASSYTIIVQAMDDNPVNPMGSTVPLHISVNDVNDNAPEFEDNPIVVTVREHTEVRAQPLKSVVSRTRQKQVSLRCSWTQKDGRNLPDSLGAGRVGGGDAGGGGPGQRAAR